MQPNMTAETIAIQGVTDRKKAKHRSDAAKHASEQTKSVFVRRVMWAIYWIRLLISA